MYVVIETGGKQYRVKEGDIIDVEMLDGEKNITFEKILFFSDENTMKVGTPHVENCKVEGEILERLAMKLD